MSASPSGASEETNPFLRYRDRLESYQHVTSGDVSDTEFVDIVGELDAAVAAVWGHGFTTTPLVDGQALLDETGAGDRLHIKAELETVGGSHKARHLFGAAVALELAERAGSVRAQRLAIASCGNAALAAAVIAQAGQRPLDVFVPEWAPPGTLEQLNSLGASVNICERRSGELGDPCHLRMRESVDGGATAFSVQGTDTPTSIDGARTIGWEIADQIPGPVADLTLWIQVGGGALATAVSTALADATVYPVQAEGCAPLRRAWDQLRPDFDFDAAKADPTSFMWPWDEPSSAATGILDDITYDWLPLARQTLRSGGEPVVASESAILEAGALARAHTDFDVSFTGTAGLAGLLAARPESGHHVVLFSGVDRGD